MNMVRYLKKILSGGLSSVNTQLAFDTEILLPNNKINYKRDDLKIMCSLKLDLDKKK